MANLDVWKDYVTVINAARLNAIRDHIMTNEANISYHQTLIDANTTGVYTNTNDIANLSATRLPRDGSLPMTGPLVCNSGVKTNSLTTVSGGIIDCQKELQVRLAVAGDGSDFFGLYSNFWIDAPYIKLYPFGTSAKGKIMVGTPMSDGTVALRMEIPGGEDNIDIKLKDAHLKPYYDNSLNLGSSDKRWKDIYSTNGNFSTITAIKGNFSAIGPIDTMVLPINGWLDIKWGMLWSGGEGCDGLSLFSGDFRTEKGSSIVLYNENSPSQGSIDISTKDDSGNLKTRIWVWGGYETSWVTIYNAHLVPGTDNELGLGSPGNRWSESHIVTGYFDEINASVFNVPRTMPFYLENPSSGDKYLLGAGTVSTMYQFNTTVTLTGYKLMMLTSASDGYIKVTIDDAKGWSYEKTYSLGSAGGYRYNESFIHIIESDSGIQLKISNCSHISSTSIVLEYK